MRKRMYQDTLAILVIGMLFLFLLAGCATKATKNPHGTETSNKASISTGSYQIEIATTKKQFSKDELIPLRITLLNMASAPVTIHFDSGQQYDVVAKNSGGTEIWRWSKGQSFIQMIEDLKLPAREGKNFFAKIDPGTLKSGKYTLGATISASEFTNQVVEIKIEIL